MANAFDAEPRSVYERVAGLARRTSLDALVNLVPPETEVLDVGIGDGALGERLKRERRCSVDGVTLSAAEAQRAAAQYRRIEVADLNQAPLHALFAGQRYRVIICADVLEHVVRPGAILDSCRELLADDGWLLISVPNVGYGGLMGELLAGDFTYRLEGLLDRTHLRFFTRRSLLRLLKERGWHADRVDAVTVNLPDSEFAAGFDRLPPSVWRYVLTMPDALSYQFVVRARLEAMPAELRVDFQPEILPSPAAVPTYSVLLYLRSGLEYCEDQKVMAAALIGEDRQTVRFPLPAGGEPLVGMRLDPADRPGFLHLHAIRLLDSRGRVLWNWDGTTEALGRGMCQQLLFRTPWFASGGVVLLMTGDDPFFEVPVDAASFRACRSGGVLEVDLAWPMSADYPLFLDELSRHRGRESLLQQQVRDLGAEVDARSADARRAAADAASLQNTLLVERAAAQALHAASARWDAEIAELRRQRAELQRHVSRLQHQVAGMMRQLDGIASSSAFRIAASVSPRLRGLADRRPQPVEPLAPDLAAPEVPRAEARDSRPVEVAEVPRVEPVDVRPVASGVDVIVPVYKGLAETRTCLESVLASTADVPVNVIVIDDASPEPEITGYLRSLRERDERVLLIENSGNAGFVECANRGMRLNPDHDVILLNSDTEVAGDWIDRLRRAAYREPRIGTVTPFSNSATICSYPRFCVDNPLPADISTAALDRYFATENRDCHQDIPTAIGFCMFMRRDCIEEIGLFDVEQFGRGYGEENDFSMRARAAGWRNVVALDTFVRHDGGVSFGEEKAARVQAAQETLARLHPYYAPLVMSHIEADPALPARLRVDLARIRSSGLPSVLLVTHVGGGGTERHVREVAGAVASCANMFMLRPTKGGEALLEWLRNGEEFRLRFVLPSQYDDLLQALQALGVAHVHFHHLQGYDACVRELPAALGVTHDFTIHDFHAVCPQVTLSDESGRYCGEQGVEQCHACLDRRPAPEGTSIEVWRDGFRRLLESARRVFTPSADAAARMQRYFPALEVTAVPHFDMDTVPSVVAPAPLAGKRPLRIAVIGALNEAKGADLLDSTAAVAAARGSPLDFHLIGWAYRPLRMMPEAKLTVHGEYLEADLSEIVARVRPDLVWFTALWPETYSYTLSAALNARLPIVAPDLGAFPERLSRRPWTWICPWDRDAVGWVDFFEALVRDHFNSASEPFPAPRRESEEARFAYERDYLAGIEARQDHHRLEWMFLWQHRVGRWPRWQSRP